MSLNKRIIFGIIVILLIASGSYIFENVSKEHGLKSGTVIRVLENNNLVSLMGVDVIKSLTAQDFPGEQNAQGPTLLYVMGAAGIGEFNNVEIKGLKENAYYKAGKDEITRDYILYPTKRGTVSLGKKSDPQHFLVEDVSEINKIN